jgi:hypothetical protein
MDEPEGMQEHNLHGGRLLHRLFEQRQTFGQSPRLHIRQA